MRSISAADSRRGDAVAFRVNSVGALLDSIVDGQHGLERAQDRAARRRHQHRGDSAMVQTQPGSDGEWLAAAKALYRGEQNLLLDADVLEKSAPELAKRFDIDISGIGGGATEQSIEASVVALEEAADGLFVRH